MKKTMSKLVGAVLALGVAITFGVAVPQTVNAKETTITPNGTIYVFAEKGKYVISDATETNPSAAPPIGTLSIAGNAKSDGTMGGFEKIDVSNENLTISYQFDLDKLSKSDNSWYLVSDKTSSINGVELEGDINRGAILVETSFDGENWIKTDEIEDYFAADQSDPVYITKDTQQLNGCYFKITVAYKEERVVNNKKFLFADTSEKERRKVAEVYKFYVVNDDAKASNVSSPQDKPREVFQDSKLAVNAGKDTGYSKTNAIVKGDVHQGWGLGSFTVNGYTQDQKDSEGNYVFLKNVGDQVTLWFTLDQDIDMLDGNETLSIGNDKKGYDEAFNTETIGMGRGTLIIRYTDLENVTHDPVIYENYLAACATTSANTRVCLYEEGIYEVALDYEIKSVPRKVGPVEVVPEYFDYRTSFTFSVYNSSTMLYPFDVVTGSELIDRSVTPNGFRIDLANSKDLSVNVTRTAISVNEAGKHVEDVRTNRAAKDGETYTDEGKYTLKVTNSHAGDPTIKTIYVGTDPFLIAMANNDMSAKELDAILAEGYSLSDDGTLVASSNVSAETEQKVTEATEAVAAQQEADLAELNGMVAVPKTVAEQETQVEENVEEIEETSSKQNALPAIVIVVFAVLISALVVVMKSKSGSKRAATANRMPGGQLPNRRSEVIDTPIIDVAALDDLEDTSDEDSWNDESNDEEDY